MSIPVVTVDGPAASGKGTLAAGIARALGFHLLDSGALYRMVAFRALVTGTPADKPQALAALAAALAPRFDDDSIWLEGKDVSVAIRAQEVGTLASKVAAFAEVRQALLAAQRLCRRLPGLVADGRDMGTVVFPDADCKFFITASAEARAERRYNQLIEKGLSGNMPDLLQEIKERDARDSTRSAAPLKPADDAVLIDTTSLLINEVLDRALQICRARLSK